MTYHWIGQKHSILMENVKFSYRSIKPLIGSTLTLIVYSSWRHKVTLMWESQTQAINNARIRTFTIYGLEIGAPLKAEYHPEGGQSLPDFEYIPDNQDLIGLPYWALTFKVPRGFLGRNDLTEIRIIRFEGGRQFFQQSR